MYESREDILKWLNEAVSIRYNTRSISKLVAQSITSCLKQMQSFKDN